MNGTRPRSLQPRAEGDREAGFAHIALAVLIVLLVALLIYAAVDSSRSSKPAATATQTRTPIDPDVIAKTAEPALATITTAQAGSAGTSSGSGIVLTGAGQVLTNNHVIANARAIAVRVGGGGRAYAARVVGYDVADDIAVLQLQDAPDLPTMHLAVSSAVKLGDPVVSLGNGASVGPQLSQGAITDLRRKVEAADPNDPSVVETLTGMFESTASVQPGQSGGPLLDARGSVIGMTTAASVGGRFREQTRDDLSYAIPIDHVLAIAQQITAGRESATVHVGERAVLGIGVGTAGAGAAVTSITATGPVAATGIRVGDTIVSIDGVTVASPAGLDAALGAHHPGDVVKVGWLDRTSTFRFADVRLIAGPPL